MSMVSKKPAAAGVSRVSAADGPSPSTSPTRNGARPSTPTSNTPAGVSRTRSLRSTAPLSARAAATRRESLLGNSTTTDQQAREEAAATIQDLRDRLAAAEASGDEFRKQTEVLQSRLEEALKEQAQLEERLHEGEEQIESLRNEKRDAARQMREMEAIYEGERSAMMKERDEMGNREEEMQTVIQRLKDSLAQRNNGDDEVRLSRQANHSPSVDGGSFAPPSSLHRSDSRNNSKLLLQKDKLIESLRLELAEAQIKLVESENRGGGRLHEVERLLMEARMANARLMEDNESYQLLLQERTLNGEFAKSDFTFMGGASANQEALNALEGRTSVPSLADELSSATEGESDNYRRLETELRTSKEQNKALTLYINRIIERLLQHQEFEHILDQSNDPKPNTEKDLPPPPPDKDTWTGASLLQRTKSMVAGTKGSQASRPRPMSVSPLAQGSVHNDPETAPKIPFGNLTRSTSVRRTRPMSEQFTGAGGTSLISQMYKGPDGPISPTLTDPRRSQNFYTSSHLTGRPSTSGRVPSGSQAPPSSGNFPGMRSETSSISGDSNDLTTPPSQSPPRHEKTTTFAGNKPRPLRLVQENSDSVKPDANKRASWMNWAANAWSKKEEAPTNNAIPE